MSDKKGFWSLFSSNKEETENTQMDEVKDVSNVNQKKESSKQVRQERRCVTQESADYAVELLQSMLEKASLEGKVSLKSFTETFLALDINQAGDDNGRLIGKQGLTVLAFQVLLKQILFRQKKVSCKISIDVDGYKSRQRSQFNADVMLLAQQVIDEGGEIALAAMNAPDRRAVHVMFENHEILTTESQGEGDLRHVVIKRR